MTTTPRPFSITITIPDLGTIKSMTDLEAMANQIAKQVCGAIFVELIKGPPPADAQVAVAEPAAP